MVAQYLKVCRENEIREGQIKSVTVDGEPVILARENGEIFALEGFCSHDGGEFDAGEKVIDGQIECPRHGARFDIRTGEATRMPAVAGIARYDVKIDDGYVHVNLDD